MTLNIDAFRNASDGASEIIPSKTSFEIVEHLKLFWFYIPSKLYQAYSRNYSGVTICRNYSGLTFEIIPDIALCRNYSGLAHTFWKLFQIYIRN